MRRFASDAVPPKVVVEAIRAEDPSKRVTVTEAQVVYVNLGKDRKPQPIELHANAVPRLVRTGRKALALTFAAVPRLVLIASRSRAHDLANEAPSSVA